MAKPLEDTQLTEAEMNAIRQEAMEFAGIGLYRYKFDGTVIFMDRTALRLFGLEKMFSDPSQVVGTDISDLLVYIRPKRLLRDMIRETGQVHALEYPFKTLDGEERWLRNDSYLTRDPQTGEEIIQATIRDITPIKQAQERIARLNIVLRTIRHVNTLITRGRDRDKLLQSVCGILVETGSYASAWIAIFDESAALAAAAEAGLSHDFSHMLELLSKGDLPECGRRVLKQSEALAIQDPNPTCHNCPLAAKHGRQHRICVRLEHGGTIYGFLTASGPANLILEEERSLLIEVAADIALALHDADLEAKRTLAEKALRESEEHYRILAENARDVIWSAELSLRLTFISPSVEHLLGLTPEEMVGRQADQFLTPASRKLAREALAEELALERDGQANPARSRILELEQVSKRGSPVWTEVSLNFIRDELGRAVGLLGVTRDITPRKRAEQELKESFDNLRRTMEATVRAVAATAEKRDPYTAGHQERVARLAFAIAQEMDLSRDQLDATRVAATLHDIGKVSIPLDILNKPGPLTELEASFVKVHPQTAYEVLKTIPFPWPVAEIVLQHHERMNGSGYPAGLSGDEILLEARILGVADTVEAMAAHRPFRPAMGLQAALREISQNKGVLFDPRVAKACLTVFARKSFRFDHSAQPAAAPRPLAGPS